MLYGKEICKRARNSNESTYPREFFVFSQVDTREKQLVGVLFYLHLKWLTHTHTHAHMTNHPPQTHPPTSPIPLTHNTHAHRQTHTAHTHTHHSLFPPHRVVSKRVFAPSGARTLDPRYIRPMRYQLRQWSFFLLLLEVGFEPTPPKREELKSPALDPSAIQAQEPK